MEQGFSIDAGDRVDALILALNREGHLFSKLSFCLEGDRPRRLGSGGFSIVYEMEDPAALTRRYALKVIGTQKHTQTAEEFWNTARIQAVLSAGSPYVVGALSAVELAVALDAEGGILSVESCREDGGDAAEAADSGRHSSGDAAEAADSGQSSGGDDADCDAADGRLHLMCLLMERLEPILHTDRYRHVTPGAHAPATEREVLVLALQVGQALLSAHEQYVLHRDVKLENIFWNEAAGRYQLGDFGVAKYTGGQNAQTMLGTDGYGAPEIWRALRETYDQTADVYSFGITLYLLLNDLRFPGSDGYHAIRGLQYAPDFVFPAPAHASVEMTRLIRRMCSYDPRQRCQHMGEALLELAALSRDAGIPEAEHVYTQADIVTKTYREAQRTEAATEEAGAIEAPGRQMSRVEQKKAQALWEGAYRGESRRLLAALALVALLLCYGMEPGRELAVTPLILILVPALAVEALLQRIREFDRIFGVALLILTYLSATAAGVRVMHLLVVLSLLVGEAALSVAVCAAMAGWVALHYVAWGNHLAALSRLGLGWVFLIVLLVLLYRYAALRAICGKMSGRRGQVAYAAYHGGYLLLALIGVALWALQKAGLYTVAAPVARMHLGRTGALAALAVFVLEVWDVLRDNEPDGA